MPSLRLPPSDRTAAVLLATLGLLGGTATPAARATTVGSPRPPNILLIYTDDHGYGELGCYGGTLAPTPHIDSLAANGVRFTQGYVSAPLCSPSRAGLLTGRAATRFGHENNAMAEGGGLPLSETTLAQRLKALGYATAIVGKWHLGNSPEFLPLARGFDEHYGTAGNPQSYFKPNRFIDSRLSPEIRKVAEKDFYTTDAYARRAAEWIGEKRAQPWFLYLAFNAIHSPFEATDRYLRRVAHVANPQRRVLAAMLSALDDAVGTVLARLRETRLEADTLLFLISDNGAPEGRGGNGPLRGGKHQVWEGGIRLPFLMRWPGRLPAGLVYPHPVVQLDVLPTCLAAAGARLDPAWQLDGTNLLPYLTGHDTHRPHENLYWKIDGMWAVRHGDLKLIHPIPGDAPPRLFDLAKDPGETTDLAAARPDEVRALAALWTDWNREQAEVTSAKAKKKIRRIEESYRAKAPGNED